MDPCRWSVVWSGGLIGSRCGLWTGLVAHIAPRMVWPSLVVRWAPVVVCGPWSDRLPWWSVAGLAVRPAPGVACGPWSGGGLTGSRGGLWLV